jgi:hypothetical protein
LLVGLHEEDPPVFPLGQDGLLDGRCIVGTPDEGLQAILDLLPKLAPRAGDPLKLGRGRLKDLTAGRQDGPNARPELGHRRKTVQPAGNVRHVGPVRPEGPNEGVHLVEEGDGRPEFLRSQASPLQADRTGDGSQVRQKPQGRPSGSLVYGKDFPEDRLSATDGPPVGQGSEAP